MKKKYIVLASSLLLLGALIFGGMMTVLKWNFKGFSTAKYETNVHEITEDFTDIKILADEGDIIFLPAEDGKTTVTCLEEKNAKHAVTVKDGALSIEIQNTKKWYHYISIGTAKTKVTVSLPVKEYGALQIAVKTGDVDLPKGFSFASADILATTGDITSGACIAGDTRIKASTGRIQLNTVSTGALDLTVSTGNIFLAGVKAGDTKIAVSTGKTHLTDCKLASLETTGSTGDLTIESVLIEGLLSAERSTGDIRLIGCDAGEISIVTDTGDVDGSFLSDKVVFATTDTGKVNVPRSTAGGRCEIQTDTGDIKITIG